MQLFACLFMHQLKIIRNFTINSKNNKCGLSDINKIIKEMKIKRKRVRKREKMKGKEEKIR